MSSWVVVSSACRSMGIITVMEADSFRYQSRQIFGFQVHMTDGASLKVIEELLLFQILHRIFYLGAIFR
jgi:hypothetical protein